MIQYMQITFILSMHISNLRTDSKFIDKLIDTGYDPSTEIYDLLRDMGLPPISANDIVIRYDSDYHPYYRVTSSSIENTLSIYDELSMSCSVSATLLQLGRLNNMMDRYIINHTIMKNPDILHIYLYGYRIITYDTKYELVCIDKDNILRTANGIQNGAYIETLEIKKRYRNIDDSAISILNNVNFPDVRELVLRDTTMFDKLIQNFSGVTNIDISDETYGYKPSVSHIIASVPFLKKLSAYGLQDIPTTNRKHITTTRYDALESVSLTMCDIDDATFDMCKKLQSLTITNTRCVNLTRIPSTITNLYISDSSITDSMLLQCKKVRMLNIYQNDKITTCNPFAKSLREVVLSSFTGITDVGLALCKNIKILFVSGNSNISTCEPFAKSLRKLDAEYASAINDDGIKLCTNLRELYASHNKNITTCKPFAKSLKILAAHGSCGICDAGLRSCVNLKFVTSTNNMKITLSLHEIRNELI